MPTIPFQLPSGKILPLTYAVEFPSLSSLYFQAARIGELESWPFLKSDICRLDYVATQDLYKARRRLPNFDAVVAPPSGRSDAGRLKSWLISSRSMLDISPRFSREGTTAASTTSDPEHSHGQFSYSSYADEVNLRSLMIIDDAIASGRTVDNILLHLTHHGFDQSKYTVEVVVWALLPQV